MLIWLILIPLLAGLLCLAMPFNTAFWSLLRRLILVTGAAGHFALVLLSWQRPFPEWATGRLALDPLGHLFITLISLLFLATAIYFVGYHRKALISQRVFLACMLALLATLSFVCVSQHLGMLWVALEASSLAVTPLIYFRLGPRALEATWKFLLMNSVGIALALLGTFAIALATSRLSGEVSLSVDFLRQHARALDVRWLRVGFLLALVGYGTKMGLAPMHSWKPDAYGEAPPPIAAFLAGGMTLAAFLGILRVFQICLSAGLGPFAGLWLCLFGLLSIAVAAVFIVGNRDYRRLLAYTSVEHMGVLVVGIGLSAWVAPGMDSVGHITGAYSSLLHAMHNTLNKGALFFAAGILWRLYGTSRTADIRGAIHRHRMVAILLLAGLCATSGIPPFGMFFSELGILIAAMHASQWWIAGAFALTLAVVFVGLWTAMLPMIFGQPVEAPSAVPGERLWRRWVMGLPAFALILLALGLGAYQPDWVTTPLQSAAATLLPPPATVTDSDPPDPLAAVDGAEVRP